MADLTLDYDQLEERSKTLKRQKAEFDTLIMNVTNTITTIEQVWNDRAAQDFIDKFSRMKQTFTDFGTMLQGFSDHVHSVAHNYKDLQTSIINSQRF